EAQAEARVLMLSAQNILNPKDGKPDVTPSQDMVLGNYYLTMERAGAIGEGSVYNNKEEAITANHNGHEHLHTRIAVQASSLNNQTITEKKNSKLIVTTVRKLLFNEIIPTTFPYMNEPTINNLEEETPNGYFLEMGEDIVK